MSWKENFNDNIQFGLTDMLILNLLTEQDMYSYDLAKKMKERTHGAFPGVIGRIYGPLYRMEKQGMISSRKEDPDKKNARFRYHIEELGKEYLEYGRTQSRMVLAEYLNNI